MRPIGGAELKLAYLVHFRGGSETGIFRKIATQAAAWKQMGAEVGLFVACGQESKADWESLATTVSVRTPQPGIGGRLLQRDRLCRDLASWRPDVLYERYGLFYPGLLRLRGIPTVLEVNGDELSEFRITSKRRYWYCRTTRRLILSRAVGAVYVTEELSRRPSFASYRIPTKVIANGIRLADLPELGAPSNAQPRLIFLGHPDTPWHGADRIVELARAFPAWHFDVVGPRRAEIGEDLPPNLLSHGVMRPAEFWPLMAEADVAIGTLAVYRKRIGEGSSLKLREYLACGLPAIIAYNDTDFPDRVPFLLHLPNEPDNIRPHLPTIEQFVLSWMGRRVARSEIARIDLTEKERLRLEFIAQFAS